MIGNGVDMYDLILDLTDNNSELIQTDRKFWVGVIEGLFPSPPIPRRKSRCYAPYPVYLYHGRYIFRCSDAYFYEIPDNEHNFIQ